MYLETAASVHLYIIFPVHRHQRNFTQHFQYTVGLGIGIILNIILYLIDIYLYQRLLCHDFHPFQLIVGFRREHCSQIDHFS